MSTKPGQPPWLEGAVATDVLAAVSVPDTCPCSISPCTLSSDFCRRAPSLLTERLFVFLLSLSLALDRPSQRTAALWKTNPFNRAQLPETFKIADASGDGRIDKEEFRQLLGVNASQAELEKLFAQIDKDGRCV